MAIQIQGNGGTTQEIDATFRAARVSIRPAEVIGYFTVSGASGALTGVAANGPVFSFRNTGSNLILVRRLSIGFVTTTAFTTAQGLDYQMLRANSFTGSDSGGTALFTAGQNKHRNSFTNITSAPDIRISSTGALTAGTRTLETAGMGIAGGSSTAVGTSMQASDLLRYDSGDYPLVLAQNEGFVVTNGIAMGAAGVIRLQVSVEYAETAAY
jgi:hypothetical protein